jgi:signal peptidase
MTTSVRSAARLLLVYAARTALGVFVLLLIVSVAPTVLGWTSLMIVSGSMEPRIRPGDILIAQPVDPGTLLPGQVVVVDNPADPGTLLVHRLVRRDSGGSLITRGDANATIDSTPVTPSAVRGLPRLRVPFVGLPVVWLRAGRYGTVALATVGLLSLIATACTRAGTASGRRGPSGTGPTGLS